MNHSALSLITRTDSLSSLSPVQLHDVLNFLIAHESAPGGPYLVFNTVEQNIHLNEKIFTLFANAGKHLTGTYAYLETSLPRFQTQMQYAAPPHPTRRAKRNCKPYILQAQEVHTTIQQRLLAELSPEIYQHILPVLQSVIEVDTYGEISQLVRHLSHALPANTVPAVDDTTFSLLGQANFYTWMAYTLYDTVIDVDTNNLIRIPAANILQRMAVNAYEQAGLSPRRVAAAFTEVDHANVDELLYCRAVVTKTTITLGTLPDTSFLKTLLSSRSSVHYLGLLEVLRSIKNSSFHHRKSKQLFNLYCAARQLCDDLHDWEDDLRNGRLTYVVCTLLKAAHITPGTYTMEPLIKRLRLLYWQSQLSRLLDECLDLASQAQQAYTAYLTLPAHSTFEIVTIAPIIQACKKAQKALQYDKAFLVAMQFN